MKTVKGRLGQIGRLGVFAAALLLGQQAIAAGTDAGTTVTNSATVDYTVGANPQTAVVSNAADFLVDRRVDFTLTADGTSDTVNPGDTGLTFDMTLQNDSNSVMDYEITLTQLASTDPAVNGNVDTDVDVANVVFTTYVDNIAEDANTVISVTGDALLTFVNADVANIRITATARDPSGDAGNIIVLADTSASPDDPNVVDNVLADAGNDGVESGEDGMVVASAAVTVSKSYGVFSDPINNTTNPKAIPGAIIEYVITIDNTAGAVDATAISISDVVDANVEFCNAANCGAEPYAGGTGNIDFGNGASVCLAEDGGTDTNGDGCVLTAGTLTIAGSDLAGTPITVAAAATLEIRFRVRIPTTP